ncbi:unnamed protein product [Caenorhabditis auriculariae]|uniref:Uncharacterized protein n=1 Tax=Caenorhabditis auriculariae TaxID=2777116 RepID=A0A8S1HY47_9PELO|nr:unnamed protein product [Caenorhabditis auriculariae]
MTEKPIKGLTTVVPHVEPAAPQIPNQAKTKRFSLVPKNADRRVTIRPYESFRERNEKETSKSYTFGYASLSADSEGRRQSLEEEEERSDSPTPSVFSIYGEEVGPSTSCEQPVGVQADLFISSLEEKVLVQLKKFIENTPREEHMYFVWIKDSKTKKITVLSLKTLENHLKNDSRVRRVKWRHLSTERVSIYRYSIPAITYENSRRCRECVCRHKKLCLLFVWLSFVLFLCLVVVLGSLSPDDKTHPFVHYHPRNTTTPSTINSIVPTHPSIAS